MLSAGARWCIAIERWSGPKRASLYILDVLSVALGDLGFFYIAVDIAIVVQKFSIRIAESRNHAMSRSDSRVASSAIPVENFCINFAIQRNIEEPSRP